MDQLDNIEDWTKLKIGQKGKLHKMENCTKWKIGQNRTKLRIGQTGKLDKIEKWTKLDKIKNWTKLRIGQDRELIGQNWELDKIEKWTKLRIGQIWKVEKLKEEEQNRIVEARRSMILALKKECLEHLFQVVQSLVPRNLSFAHHCCIVWPSMFWGQQVMYAQLKTLAKI